MARDFEDSDEGAAVMTADGDQIGTVHSVSGSTAHVQPTGDLDRSTRRRLGWTEEGEDTYPLRKSRVEHIDDEGVHLKQNL